MTKEKLTPMQRRAKKKWFDLVIRFLQAGFSQSEVEQITPALLNDIAYGSRDDVDEKTKYSGGVDELWTTENSEEKVRGWVEERGFEFIPGLHYPSREAIIYSKFKSRLKKVFKLK